MNDKPSPSDPFTIRQSIWIDAPPERVWRALTTKAELARWFVTDVEGEIRPGAEATFVFASCDARLPGRWLEIEPGRRVAFLFDKSRVTVEIIPLDGGTLVKLTDTGLPPDLTQVAGQSEGWAGYLCVLKVWIEMGRDLRADQPRGTIIPG